MPLRERTMKASTAALLVATLAVPASAAGVAREIMPLEGDASFQELVAISASVVRALDRQDADALSGLAFDKTRLKGPLGGDAVGVAEVRALLIREFDNRRLADVRYEQGEFSEPIPDGIPRLILWSGWVRGLRGASGARVPWLRASMTLRYWRTDSGWKLLFADLRLPTVVELAPQPQK
jgi:hypothetical protein